MPQLERGGKFVFGWSVLHDDGSLRLPSQVVQEYCMPARGRLLVMSGSRTSGGLRAATMETAAGTVFSGAVDVARPDKVTRFKGALVATAEIDAGVLTVPRAALDAFEVGEGARLLAIRGSHVAVVLAARGPLVALALEHPEIDVFA